MSYRAQLEAGNSDALTAYLDAMSRFHNYSFGNILEIARQRPDATRVAGLYAWNQLGRKVKKGEKGIRILAPIIGFRRKKDEEAKRSSDPAAINKPMLVGFRSAYVFDVSQTDGTELPKMHGVSGDVGENFDRIVSFIKSQGIELSWTENIAPALGISYGGRIAILPGQEKAEEFSTLVHELAHEMLHKAERRTADPPTMAPAAPTETEEEIEQRKAEYEQQRQEYEADQQRKEEERKQQFEREQKEYEAEQTRREELRKYREATFERIVANAPATFTAPQLRVLLRALVNLDPYTFADDLADDLAGENENEQRSAEEVLLTSIDALTDDKLTGFAVRLALAGHRGIPREGEFDFLTEAANAFTSKAAAKPKPSKARKPAPIKAAPKPDKKAVIKKTKEPKQAIAA